MSEMSKYFAYDEAPRGQSSGDQGEHEPHRHVVQFYENDSLFLEELSRVIGAALGAGDATLIIATKAHRNGLAQRLNARGLDLAQAVDEGRYVALDAAETLAKLSLDGWPDVERFAKLIGNQITRAATAVRSERSRVVAFGEMVALLWADGKPEAAIRLEQLWNDLGRTHKFYLRCAYPMSSFNREGDRGLLMKICQEHGRVIPTESYTSLGNEEERHLSVTLLQHKAQVLDAEVSQRKKAESSLMRREAELSDFLENALEGVQQVGPDQKVLWANRALLELLGYTAEEYLGHGLEEFHADREILDEFWRKLMRRENVYNYPAKFRCKDGSVKQVRLHSNGLWEDGKFMYTRCFVRDVTEQKIMQEALRISEERLRLTQKAAKIGSWELDLDREEYVWSDEVYDMFGQTPTEYKPTQKEFLSMMYYATDRDNVEKALRTAMNKNREFEFEFRILRPDGQSRLVAARGKPFFNLGRNVVLGVFIDMASAGKTMEAGLISAAEPAEGKSKRRQRIN